MDEQRLAHKEEICALEQDKETHLSNYKSQIELYESDLQKLKAENLDATASLTNAQDQVDCLESQIADMIISNEKLLKANREEMEKLTSDIVDVKSQFSSATETISFMQETIDDLQTKNEALTNKASKLQGDIIEKVTTNFKTISLIYQSAYVVI